MQGLTTEKQENNDFNELINKKDFIILSDTWTSANSAVDYSNYCKIHCYRKYIHKRAKRGSGGIIIYYRESMEKGVKLIKKSVDGVVWVKLDKAFFGFERDIYMCCVYIPPEGSPMHGLLCEDIFESIYSDIIHFKDYGNVMLLGDWNCRTANKSDMVSLDCALPVEDTDDYENDTYIPRYSQDTRCNTWGNCLLDLCKTSGIRIVNGRSGKDMGVGKFTCVTDKGESVVDYLIVEDDMFDVIKSFEVYDLTEFSDHVPVYFSIDSSCSFAERDNHQQTSYKWNDAYCEQFKLLVTANMDFDNIFQAFSDTDLKQTPERVIDDVVNAFNLTLSELGSTFFKQERNTKKSGRYNNSGKCMSKEWFGKECHEAKGFYLQALSLYNENRTPYTRNDLLDAKKRYKLCTRKYKRRFLIERSQKIKHLRARNPREFWRLFRKQKPVHGGNIKPDEFADFFRNLANEHTSANDDIESFVDQYENDVLIQYSLN